VSNPTLAMRSSFSAPLLLCVRHRLYLLFGYGCQGYLHKIHSTSNKFYFRGKFKSLTSKTKKSSKEKKNLLYMVLMKGLQ